MLKVKKCWHHMLQADVASFFVRRKCQKNPKHQWKSMKIIHVFLATWGISMKFSGKMLLMIILKVTKNRVTPSR